MSGSKEFAPAIARLRKLAKDHQWLSEGLKNGDINMGETDKARIESLMNTYTYWMQCCWMAAWLLEAEDEK